MRPLAELAVIELFFGISAGFSPFSAAKGCFCGFQRKLLTEENAENIRRGCGGKAFDRNGHKGNAKNAEKSRQGELRCMIFLC